MNKNQEFTFWSPAQKRALKIDQTQFTQNFELRELVTEILNHRKHKLRAAPKDCGDYLWCETCEDYIFDIEIKDNPK